MKLATLGGLVFMVLGFPVAMAQAMPFPQEGPLAHCRAMRW